MEPASSQNDRNQNDRNKVWDLLKDARTALLVTVGENDAMEARPMGCLQTAFDGTLWFLTFRHSSKVQQIGGDDRVLVAYVNPEKYEYVAVSGRARVVDDRQKLEQLWTEGLRVWFPKGPADPELAMLAIDVEKADYWADPASAITYAFAYVKARVTGESPSPGEIAENKSVRFHRRGYSG
jgi:general stress protein 26